MPPSHKLLYLFASEPTAAQIIPDATLPVNSTITQAGNTRIIEGGTSAGSNLFHSFQEFSVPTGGTAFFNNALDIQNIFIRVTVGAISNIDGLIRANGNANLFPINPNVIIFVPNARLNIGGSFFASTANSIVLADGSFFSAKTPQATPLLTISVPIGLQYGKVAGSIVNQARVTNRDNFVSGRQVQLGNTLAMVGGDVRLEGGILQAPGGRVELGGLAAAGIIVISIDGKILRLNFPEGVARTDVFLNNIARVRVDSTAGGDIAINARNLAMSEASTLLARIALSLAPSGAVAGNIEINATEQVTISSGAIANLIGTVGIAQTKGGDINIRTRSLSVKNGAALSTSTLGLGNGGNISIIATDRVALDGVDSNGFSTIVISTVERGAKGNTGDINITTRSLSVTCGAQLQSLSRGQGNAGNLRITATDSVFFDGVSSNKRPSAAFATVETEAVGKGGSIDITTRSLSLTNGGVLTARTNGEGNAGNITITATETVSLDGVGIDGGSSGIFSTVGDKAVGKGGEISITTKSLAVTNGAQLLVGTLGKGDAGNVRIIATDTVSFDGVGSNGEFSGIFSSVAAPTAIGKGGLIEIETGLLSVTNRAVLNANSFGQGAAGDIQIKADSVGLNQAAIGAETVAGKGNITVRSPSLILRNRSFITTNATGSDIVGGNITLDVGVLAALENSDISANSEEFVGGNVNIDTHFF
ncbi:filamentous hemagglutinin N-terminal domain-containing protein [Microseira sp. BLCC-F43]|uniref:two-partner secretion domain-containing protein n=1 Tax=Microseira sp. BLCC-F43 TaxID=3153602 RepID=UPI0035B6EA0D